MQSKLFDTGIHTTTTINQTTLIIHSHQRQPTTTTTTTIKLIQLIFSTIRLRQQGITTTLQQYVTKRRISTPLRHCAYHFRVQNGERCFPTSQRIRQACAMHEKIVYG